MVRSMSMSDTESMIFRKSRMGKVKFCHECGKEIKGEYEEIYFVTWYDGYGWECQCYGCGNF